jgi:hypothetical protein
VIIDNNGKVIAAWAADDPLAGDMPGIGIAGSQAIKLTSADLEHLSVLSPFAVQAADHIRDTKRRMAHQAYRALQLAANDAAPSTWLLGCTYDGRNLAYHDKP